MNKRMPIFLLLLLLGSGRLKAQDSAYVINGSIEKINSGTIFLNIYEKGKTLKDSAFIQDGKFRFTGFVTSPYFASLTMPGRHHDYFTFYIEPAEMFISGRGDSLKLMNIKGSAVNTDDKLFQERMRSISRWETINSKIYEQAYKDKNTHVMDSLDKVDNDILLAKRKVVAAYVNDYPASMRGAMAIVENYSYYAEASDIRPLYNKLTPEIKQTPKGKEIKSMMETYARVAIGKPAPDISQYTPDGVLLSLSSLKGKYVLVDFWASWCGPCRRENPNVVSAFQVYKAKGFTVFGVSYDSKKESWKNAITQDHLNWNQVSDLKGWQNATSVQYGIKAIPSNVLIDPNGIIIAKNIFGDHLKDQLAELLGNP